MPFSTISNNIVAQSKVIKIPEKVKFKNTEYIVDSIGFRIVYKLDQP
nr:hypothetical protein [Mycoplasmopsis bovis]